MFGRDKVSVSILPGPHQASGIKASFMRPPQNRHWGPKAGRSAHCDRQSPGWINDIRLGPIPARAGVARVFLESGAVEPRRRWIWAEVSSGADGSRLAKDQS